MTVVDEVLCGLFFNDSEDSSFVDRHVRVYSILHEEARTVADVFVESQPLARRAIGRGVYRALVEEVLSRLAFLIDIFERDEVGLTLAPLILAPNWVGQEVIIVVFDRAPGVVKSE